LILIIDLPVTSPKLRAARSFDPLVRRPQSLSFLLALTPAQLAAYTDDGLLANLLFRLSAISLLQPLRRRTGANLDHQICAANLCNL
jgi:hypothetical protein